MPNGKYSIELGTGESTKYGIIFVLSIHIAVTFTGIY
jgi:hypothetical protein